MRSRAEEEKGRADWAKVAGSRDDRRIEAICDRFKSVEWRLGKIICRVAYFGGREGLD